ncbi:MAG: zinc ribbon domain-containing protein [Oscillospiraceae bacterium]|nr:zinc ribbon domain-containing protein [Oscillospiraceae bacterium]
MNKRPYICPKCGHNRYIADQFQATGGNFARMFDVQNKRFITVSCAACGYTELYRKQNDAGLDILDFLFNGG